MQFRDLHAVEDCALDERDQHRRVLLRQQRSDSSGHRRVVGVWQIDAGVIERRLEAVLDAEILVVTTDT